MIRLFRPQTLIVLALVAILATAAYGFAATNTIPDSNAGDGSGAISGYTASSIHYNLNGATPSNVDSVTFTIAPAVAAGGVVTAKIAGNWYSCVVAGGGTSVTCNTTSPQLTATAAASLQVVAAQ